MTVHIARLARIRAQECHLRWCTKKEDKCNGPRAWRSMRCAEGLRNTHGLSGFRALFSASSETRGSGPNALLVWLHATALCPYPEVLRRGPKPELPTLQSCSKATASKGATTTAASRLRWGRAHILPGSAKAKGKRLWARSQLRCCQPDLPRHEAIMDGGLDCVSLVWRFHAIGRCWFGYGHAKCKRREFCASRHLARMQQRPENRPEPPRPPRFAQGFCLGRGLACSLKQL